MAQAKIGMIGKPKLTRIAPYAIGTSQKKCVSKALVHSSTEPGRGLASGFTFGW